MRAPLSPRFGMPCVGLLATMLGACAARGPTSAVEVLIPREPDALAPPTAEHAPRETMVGHWTGVGRRSDVDAWAVEMDILRSEPGACGFLYLPVEKCAADLTCTEVHDGSGFRATLRLTKGFDACVDGGEASFSLRGHGVLEMKWSDGKKDRATTRFKRRDPPRSDL